MVKQKTIIYQLLPRLFGNEKSSKIPHGTIEQNGCGKLSAIDNQALHAVKEMGFTHIWFTGILEHATQTDYSIIGSPADNPQIVKGKAGSPYAIKDYYSIAPDLADNPLSRMREFEQLIERTHQAGLKVIIDFVPNHVARNYHSKYSSEETENLGETDNNKLSFDPNNNFYYLTDQSLHLPTPYFSKAPYNESPAKATGNDCFTPYPSIDDWYETIKLNYGVDYLNGKQQHFDPIPNTWHKMYRILQFWISKGVDAFRCDMAEMVPVAFWGWAISQIKQENPHVTFIAEIYNPEQYQNYIHNGKFDLLYDKVGLYDTLRSIVEQKQPASEITFQWQRIGSLQPHMLNFLENHDEQRIASPFFANDPQKGIPAMIVAATLNTNPLMIYFGQELGERGMDQEGFSGHDGRTSIFDYWQLSNIEAWRNGGKYDGRKLSHAQQKIRQQYVQLLQLCNTQEAIYQGAFFDLMYANYENPFFDSTKLYAFLRSTPDEVLLITVNFSDTDLHTSIHIPNEALEYAQLNPDRVQKAVDLLTNKTYQETPFVDRNTVEVVIPKQQGIMLKFITQ